MSNVLKRRPPASMVVSIVALIVALSGTAIAAGRLAEGDNLIRKDSLSGDRLRNHTITATQIDLAKLGVVPTAMAAQQSANARYAITATNAVDAISASNAVSATNAVNASNSLQLGGQPASDYLTSSDRIGTSGVVTSAGSASGTTVTLFKTGPFTVTMICTTTGTGSSVNLQASSTEAGSVLDRQYLAAANTATDVDDDVDGTDAYHNPSPTLLPWAGGDAPIDFEAPSGAQALVIGADGVNSLGVDCWANFAGVQ
jgi:hypothetical protein